MVLCFAADGNHKTVKNYCSFYRFPKDVKKHALWTQMAKRGDRKPGRDFRLCSCHFKGGDKRNYPSIFASNKEQQIELPAHKEKKKQSAGMKNIEGVEDKGRADVLLKAEIEQLKRKNKELQLLLEAKNAKFLFSQISEDDKLVLMYTGLPNKYTFDCVLNYISRLKFNYVCNWNVESLTLEDQLFITLQKLRQNYSFRDLAVRYSVSDTTVRNVFFTILHVLHESIFLTVMKNMPSLNKIQQSVNNHDFPNCRFLIDTTEIFIENPRRDLEAQRQTFSHYKKRQTLKGLIAVAPNGAICFVSKLWPGSTSDKIIFKECGLIKLLNPGDLILADKGFLIHDLLPQGVSLNIPPFLMNPQFTESEAKFTTKLAGTRVHVERAIQRIKGFQILDNIPYYFNQYSSVIFQVCACLVNLQNPLVKK